MIPSLVGLAIIPLLPAVCDEPVEHLLEEVSALVGRKLPSAKMARAARSMSSTRKADRRTGDWLLRASSLASMQAFEYAWPHPDSKDYGD